MANVIALGERTLYGKYNRVLSAGEINIEESEIKSLYAAGDITIQQSEVSKIRVAGDVKVDRGMLGNVNVAGVITLKGTTKADYMVVRGELTAECLECKHLVIGECWEISRINNKKQTHTKITGFLKVGVIENYHSVKIDFEHEVKMIVNGGSIISEEGIECEKIYSFGLIQAEELNAETIYIRPLATSKVENIVGSKIQITEKYQIDKELKGMPRKYFKKYYEGIKEEKVDIMEVGVIEGDDIQIDYVKAQCVSGVNVTIGELCMIDRVEYTGAIKISPKAIIGEVVKL